MASFAAPAPKAGIEVKSALNGTAGPARSAELVIGCVVVRLGAAKLLPAGELVRFGLAAGCAAVEADPVVLGAAKLDPMAGNCGVSSDGPEPGALGPADNPDSIFGSSIAGNCGVMFPLAELGATLDSIANASLLVMAGISKSGITSLPD